MSYILIMKNQAQTPPSGSAVTIGARTEGFLNSPESRSVTIVRFALNSNTASSVS